jgi:hypothetical protein
VMSPYASLCLHISPYISRRRCAATAGLGCVVAPQRAWWHPNPNPNPDPNPNPNPNPNLPQRRVRERKCGGAHLEGDVARWCPRRSAPPAPCISLYLPVSPRISLYLPVSPYSRHGARCQLAMQRGRGREIQGYTGRDGERWGEMGRGGERWGEMGRYGEIPRGARPSRAAARPCRRPRRSARPGCARAAAG